MTEQIHEHGYWLDIVPKEHHFDTGLAPQLASFFQNSDVVDLGCGIGRYVQYLRQWDIPCEGYDGNPMTSSITNGLCRIIDLAKKFDLQQKFDWVLSLEVGEHIPKEYEQVYLDNLCRHYKKGIVLSWALPGQDGLGHVNCQDNDYIIDEMTSRNLKFDQKSSDRLRTYSTLSWFKKTIMVFKNED